MVECCQKMTDRKCKGIPKPATAWERPPGSRPASSILALPGHLSLLGGQLAPVIFL